MERRLVRCGAVSAFLVMREGESKGKMVMVEGVCKQRESVMEECLSGAGLEGLTRRPSSYKQGKVVRCLPGVFVTLALLPR